MAFIKVGNKVLKSGGKVVTNDLVLFVKLGNDGKTLSVVPSKDIASTLTRYMLVLTPDSGTASEVNIGNTGTYDLSSLHGTVQDGKYTLSVYAVLSPGNTATFGSIDYYVLAPCAAMTLRFKFSKSGYDPVNAGVGSAGTWNHLIDDVWDWTNTNADWHEAFKGAFTADDNEVEIITAGDTSGVSNTRGMFAGVYSGSPNKTAWSLTAPNNIVQCADFDMHNCTAVHYMFCGSNLQDIKMDLSNVTASLEGFYAATKLTEVNIVDFSSTSGIQMVFSRSSVTRVAGIIVTSSLTTALSAFYACTELEYFGGFLGDMSSIRTYNTMFGGSAVRKLTCIDRPIDLSGVDVTDGLTQFVGGTPSLTHVTFMNGPKPGATSMLAAFNGCKVLTHIPPIDTKYIQNFNNAFSAMYELVTIPDINVDSATNVGSMFKNDYKVSTGILEMYRKLLARGSAITNHADCFLNCGRDTPEGQAALAQIPTDWGGTMST